MPLYEFVCTRCGATFEQLVRSANNLDGVLCPTCQSTQVQKKLSTFAFRGGNQRQLANARTPCAPGGA
ncbi:MAG: FmdB family transcriptional regulator [Chloroflexi bacterium]|nr:MAG: FmdB family transcriptional regulator [Chloroflexota bacterium]